MLELGGFMYKYSINDLPNAFNDYFPNHYKKRHVIDFNLKNKQTNKNKAKNNNYNNNNNNNNNKALFWPFCSNDWYHSLEFY